MTMVGYSITLGDAEVKAKYAANAVRQAIIESVIQNQQDLFDTQDERSAAHDALKQLDTDESFRARLEAAFVAWIAETHTLLPPTKL